MKGGKEIDIGIQFYFKRQLIDELFIAYQHKIITKNMCEQAGESASVIIYSG